MNIWSKINKPLPGWLTLMLLCGVAVSAAVPTYTGIIVAAASASPSAVPLTVAGTTSQFANIAQVCQASSCNDPYFFVGNTGQVEAIVTPSASPGVIPVIQPTNLPSPQSAVAGAISFKVTNGDVTFGGNGTAAGFNIFLGAGGTNIVPESSSQPFQFANAANTNNNVRFPDANGVMTEASPGATLTYVPPTYTAAGAAVASTLHGVFGTDSITTPCTTPIPTLCGVFTETLSGAAVFASSTSYSCSAINTSPTANGVVVIFPSNVSGSSVSFAYYATGTGFTSRTVSMNYFCIGT